MPDEKVFELTVTEFEEIEIVKVEEGKYRLGIADSCCWKHVYVDRKHLKDLAQAIEMELEKTRKKSITVPCQKMPTRACPVVYGETGCGDRPCARFQSDNEAVWLDETNDD